MPFTIFFFQNALKEIPILLFLILTCICVGSLRRFGLISLWVCLFLWGFFKTGECDKKEKHINNSKNNKRKLKAFQILQNFLISLLPLGPLLVKLDASRFFAKSCLNKI